MIILRYSNQQIRRCGSSFSQTYIETKFQEFLYAQTNDNRMISI